MTDATLLHVTTAAELEAASTTGALAPAGLATDGFVHLCTPAQLDGVLGRWFPGVADLVVLGLDPAALGAEVRWVEVYPGEHFPHLYGPVPLAAVRASRRVDR